MDGNDERCMSPDDTDLLSNEVLPPRKSSSFSSGKEFISTTVTFHKLNYVMPVKEHRKKVNKVILDDCR